MSGHQKKNQNKHRNTNPERFFSGVLVLTASNILVKAVGLLFKIPMNYIVGDTGMGYYNSAYSIYTFFYMLSTAGLPVAVSIMVSEARGRGNTNQTRQILKTSLLLFLLIGSIGSVLMFTCAETFAGWISSSPASFCVLAIAPSMFFVCITGALRGYFQGCQRMVPTAVSQVIEALCKMVFGILFAVYAIRNNFQAPIIAAYAVCGLTIGTGLSMLYLVIVKCFDTPGDPLSADSSPVLPVKELLKRFLLISLPITLSASVMSLTNMIDTVLIQRLLQNNGMSQEMATTLYGNYTSLAVPLFNLPPVFVYPIAYSIVPMISKLRASEQRKQAKNIMISSLRIASIIGMPCALGLSALSKPILSMFYRAESAAAAAPLLTLLAPSSFFVCLLAITNSILQAIGKADKPVYAMLVGGAVEILSSLFLTQHIGMAGTPVSTFLCYLTVIVISLYYIYKYAGISLSVGTLIIKPLAASVICVLTALVCFSGISCVLPEGTAVMLAILTAVLVYIPLILRTRILTKEDLVYLPHKEKIISFLMKCHMLTEKDFQSNEQR